MLATDIIIKSHLFGFVLIRNFACRGLKIRSPQLIGFPEQSIEFAFGILHQCIMLSRLSPACCRNVSPLIQKLSHGTVVSGSSYSFYRYAHTYRNRYSHFVNSYPRVVASRKYLSFYLACGTGIVFYGFGG